MIGKVLSVRAESYQRRSQEGDFVFPLLRPPTDQTRRRKLHSVRFRLTVKAHLFRCGSFPNGNGRFRWGRTSNEGERMFAVQADGADRSL